MKTLLTYFLFMLLPARVLSQSVGIGTTVPHASSQMDITSATKGLLLPRMTPASISAITNPAKGLMVYDSVTNRLMVNMGNSVTPDWQTIVAKSGWGLSGNTGTNVADDFIGTADVESLRFRVNNMRAGLLDISLLNTYFGVETGAAGTGLSSQNAAFGYNALRSTVIGSYNVAVGAYALDFSNANYNSAIGYQAMRLTTSGYGNTAVGYNVLYANTTGAENTALGLGALFNNAFGNSNVAAGNYALSQNRESFNTGVGVSVLNNTDLSQYNTGIGYHAGTNYNNGYNNVFVGANTDVNGSGYFNVICVGQGTVATGSSQARFGNPATVSYGGWAGWSNLSDGRFKKNVKANVPGIAFITQLRPVTYNLEAVAVDAFLHQYDKEPMSTEGKANHERALKEKEQITYTGFIAQEVEAVAKQLGFTFSGVEAPKNSNDTYSLRYAEFVVPLVKGMQEQQELIAGLRKENDALKKRVEKLELLQGEKR